MNLNTIGFIGCGNMGKALIQGILSSGVRKADEILVSDVNEDALEALSLEFPGLGTTTENLKVVSEAGILFLAVKPHIYEPVIREIRDTVTDDTLVVTIAAGVTLNRMYELFDRSVKVIRTMPNTPAMVGEGMTALCPGVGVDPASIDEVELLFKGVGRVERLGEDKIDAYTALCGSSPAYVFLFIEALADGAVREGIPRDKAYEMGAQAVLGAAKMILETGRHPGELKDAVCSPGGTTIEAVGILEEKGFRSAVMEAVRVCADKSRKMS